MRKKYKKMIAKIFSISTFSSILLLFVWELLEELIEEGIAWGISTLFFKTLSIIGVVGATQTIKFGTKQLIKVITYNKGNDKTLKLKKIFKKGGRIMNFFKNVGKGIVAGFKYIFVTNPQASVATVTNAFLSATVGYTTNLDPIITKLPAVMLFGTNIVPVIITFILFIVVQLFGIRWAFETNSTADERKQTEKVEKDKDKEEKAKLKVEKIKQLEIEKAKKTIDEYEKAKKILEENK